MKALTVENTDVSVSRSKLGRDLKPASIDYIYKGLFNSRIFQLGRGMIAWSCKP